MLKVALHFNYRLGLVVMGFMLIAPHALTAAETTSFKKNEVGLYRDVFDQNIYYEVTKPFHLDDFYRMIFNRKKRSANINDYDEVPDNSFFTNRHEKARLTQEELKKGYRESAGLDVNNQITITKGKSEGLHPGYFVKDAKGDAYLIKFDSVDNFELATSAEVIASRFYHAIGYNVPEYTIAEFEPGKLVPGAGAKAYDSTGFKKDLTPERLEEYLLFVPQTSKGKLRVSASKIVAGENIGAYRFRGTRKDDPSDIIERRDRREIRALRVFGSWLSNYDTRESNTLNMAVEKDGVPSINHYLIDFSGALGSSADGAKPPMFSHEYMMDYGEAAKSLFGFGFREKPWQKRWTEVGEAVPQSPAVGYFDNRYFDPGKYKMQLPYAAFKDLTDADGFWAAKIIMSFSDEDIRSMVAAGELSTQADSDYLAKTLSERRDMIGRYWFGRTNPLDAFDVQNQRLVFEDLAVRYGFEPATAQYQAEIIGHKGKKNKKVTSLTSSEPAFSIDPNWFSEYSTVDFLIRTSRADSKSPSDYVAVTINGQGVVRIIHQD